MLLSAPSPFGNLEETGSKAPFHLGCCSLMATATTAISAIPGVWRGQSHATQSLVQASGHAALDAALGQGGLPRGAITEVLTQYWGMGEFDLFLPLMRQLAQQPAASAADPDSQRVLALIAPPFTPNALALAARGLPLSSLWWLRPDRSALAWWSAEQLLRCGNCPLLLFWSEDGDMQKLKRLQLAAEHGQNIALVFRPEKASQQASPAALRLRLEAGQIEVLKARGGLKQGKRVPLGTALM